MDALKQALHLLFSLDPELLQILGVTMRMSFFSTTISCLVGLPLGALIGTRSFRGKAFLKKLFFAFAIVWIVVTGYNRIHMNAHFLTDVCFGVLITYCLYALTYKLVFSIFEKGRQGQ